MKLSTLDRPKHLPRLPGWQHGEKGVWRDTKSLSGSTSQGRLELGFKAVIHDGKTYVRLTRKNLKGMDKTEEDSYEILIDAVWRAEELAAYAEKVLLSELELLAYIKREPAEELR